MIYRFFFMVCLLAWLPASHALDSDSEQPATLDADDMEMDFATGLRVYRGNVVFRQGSIHLTCEELTTYFNESDELDKAVCVGSPGRFKQRPEGAEHDVVGTAMTITMDQVEDLVTLKSQAKVVQGGTTITGRVITYNLVTEKASVKGGGSQASATSSSNDQATGDGSDSGESAAPAADGSARPSLVIQPRKKKTTEVEETAEDGSTSD